MEVVLQILEVVVLEEVMVPEVELALVWQPISWLVAELAVQLALEAHSGDSLIVAVMERLEVGAAGEAYSSGFRRQEVTLLVQLAVDECSLR